MKLLLPLTIFLGFLFSGLSVKSQVLVRGGVYDSTRMVPVPAVKVRTTSGAIAYTDSVGQYSILMNPKDSVNFTFREKSTAWFTLKDIRNYNSFDVALQVRVPEKYKSLKEVIVVGKTYQQDSVENREKYAHIFGYSKPGLKVNDYSAFQGGAPGLDPNELINLFRFKRNKSLKQFQSRLLEEEARKFVDYRFNRTTVKNLTKLEGDDLTRFMYFYRPSYDFTALSTEYQFLEYILEASKLYRQGILPPVENINK